jgi:hypothetical protein
MRDRPPKEIDGLEEARQRIGDFSLFNFTVLRKLSAEVVETDSGHFTLQVDLHLESEERTPTANIHIRCTNVSALTTHPDFWHAGGVFLSGFQIEDISAKQWDGIAWVVRDYEDDLFHFYCQRVECVSARNLKENETTVPRTRID